MNSRLLPVLLPLCLAGLIVVPRAAAVPTGTDPVQIARTATEELMNVLYARPVAGHPLSERAQPVLEKFFDFPMLTRRAVGPGWRQLTTEQQQRTTQLLTELIVRNYCARFDSVVRSRVTFAAPVPVGTGRYELPATVTHTGQNYAVVYRVEQTAAGWSFYDVILEGVSMVANYRAQFTALFQQGGADAIISALEKNLAANLPVS